MVGPGVRKGFLWSRVVMGTVRRPPGSGCPGSYVISGGQPLRVQDTQDDSSKDGHLSLMKLRKNSPEGRVWQMSFHYI